MKEDKKVLDNLPEENEKVESVEDLHGENLNDRARVLSPGMMVAKRFFRSKLSMIGLLILLALFLFSFVGPFFSEWALNGEPVVDHTYIKHTFNPSPITYIIDGVEYTIYDGKINIPSANTYGDMTWQHWLGTTSSGEDVLTNLMLGGRVSLTLGFVVIILETVFGVILGGLAGYFGGWVDSLVMRIVDVISCIPTLPIMLIMSTTLTALAPSDIGQMLALDGMGRLYVLMAFLTLIGWGGIARLVRGQILSLREQEFMLAAKASGLSTRSKIFKHLLPNVMPQLIVSMTMGLGSIILMEATLGYLGLGAPLGTPTWGSMINTAQNITILSKYPNFWLPPGICITLAILAFNFVGDGLRDAFDPKMKR